MKNSKKRIASKEGIKTPHKHNVLCGIKNSKKKFVSKEGIKTPHKHDVLCGRGGATYRHVGNYTFRHLALLNKDLYCRCEKNKKSKISKAIVNAIQGQNPPGKFLAFDKESSLWKEISDEKAILKTSQALREGVQYKRPEECSTSNDKTEKCPTSPMKPNECYGNFNQIFEPKRWRPQSQNIKTNSEFLSNIPFSFKKESQKCSSSYPYIAPKMFNNNISSEIGTKDKINSNEFDEVDELIFQTFLPSDFIFQGYQFKRN